ncbi:hypothetical protein N7540_009874 [Penicillium herquei]|nr:hypothetical protein N7540_009874 [Penicillium herquei]
MTKIFLTGITGYIAGDALATLVALYPDFTYSTLVRSPEKAEQVKAKYPNIRIVLGDLEDSALLEKESAAADIVLHAADASDHVGAAKAIATGLITGHTKENPGYWLHTGGTGILTFEDSDSGVYGNKSDKVYDDWNGVDELLTLPAHAFHRNVDQFVLDTAAKHADVLKTALLKKGPIIGAGQSIWNNVHIHDLSDVYALLVDAAIVGRTDDGLWGPRAYYLTENGEHVWGELSKSTAEAATKLGYLSEATAEPIDLESAQKYAGFESLSWGMNSRGRAYRAREILGWNPSRPSLLDELPEIVQAEWISLQK